MLQRSRFSHLHGDDLFTRFVNWYPIQCPFRSVHSPRLKGDCLVRIGPLLKTNRAKQTVMSSLFPAALLLGGLALTLLTVDTRYGTLAAQTGTGTQTKSQPADPPLPDSPGKDLVLRACVKCHNLKVITTKRASEEEWTRSVDNMINRGAELSDDEADQVIDYLSRNFKPADQQQPTDNPPPK
jgi:hypothetical protein